MRVTSSTKLRFVLLLFAVGTSLLLAKNANLLKVSHYGAGLLPHLLNTFATVDYAIPSGITVRGQDLLDTIAVVYCHRSDRAEAEAL